MSHVVYSHVTVRKNVYCEQVVIDRVMTIIEIRSRILAVFAAHN